MIAKTYDFHERMRMSEGASSKKDIQSIILSAFPNAVEVERASSRDDRNGTDYWVTMQSGQKVSVDVKVRATDWAKRHPKEDDVALEVWSVVEKQVIGWTRDQRKRTDYILFLWEDTGRWMLVPFPMLCDVFIKHLEKWCKEYKVRPQWTPYSNGAGYHSECVFVSRRTLWNELYATFGGTPKA